MSRERACRVLTRAGALVLASLCAFAVSKSPGGAHAQVVATYPESAAVLPAPPETVEVHFAVMPATTEGDPLRVHGPSGERVDAGGARLTVDPEDPSKTTLTVDLSPEAALLGGTYQAVYQVVSADTHLVIGRFSFEAERGRRDGAGLTGSSPVAGGWSTDGAVWPKLAFGIVCAGLVLGMAGCRRAGVRK
jgi:copper transport protein